MFIRVISVYLGLYFEENSYLCPFPQNKKDNSHMYMQ